MKGPRMRTHRSLVCRWWWLAPVAVLALVLDGSRGKDAAQLSVPDRNLVNTTDKNISLDFSFEEDKEKGILWKARLGKMASYGGPVVAGGQVFVCTNNENPLDPALAGAAGA